MPLTAGPFTEEATSHYVDIDGTKIHYHEAGSGPPLLCVNAFGAGMSAWFTYYRNLEALAREYRVILMDRPNYGRSGNVVYDEPVHAMDARHMAGLLDILGIDKAPMIGVSQGGTTVLTFALRYPDRITKLVIGGCSASTGGNVFLFNPPSMEGIRAAGQATREPTRENVHNMLTKLVYNQQFVTDEHVDHLYNMATSRPPRESGAAQSRSHRHNNLDDLPGLEKPVMIFHGRYDLVVTPETGVQMVGLIPDCRLVMPRCGNLYTLEMGDEFNRMALDFLRN